MPTDFWRYAEAVLDHFFPLMQNVSSTSSEKYVEEQLRDPDHANKTSGYPCNNTGCSTKLSALEAYGVPGLLSMYREDTSVLGVTLKDEIRKAGKDARLFRPMDVCAYCEALVLFSNQNEYLMSLFANSPMAVKYVTPGTDLSRLYRQLHRFNGDLYDADANAWDANFPLIVAEFICYWRSRYHPESKRIREYYRRMYNGYSSALGCLYDLVGQPSGHLLTTVDNSLANIVLMSYHAYLNHLSVGDFVSQVLFFCCGDDLIWADRTHVFSPALVSGTYADAGVYLEFESLEPKPFKVLSFVGTHPAVCKYNDLPVTSYVYDVSRLLAKSCIFRRDATLSDKISKVVSYAHLLFNDAVHFSVLSDLAWKMYTEGVQTGALSSLDPRVTGTLQTLSPTRLARVYGGLESVTFLN